MTKATGVGSVRGKYTKLEEVQAEECVLKLE